MRLTLLSILYAFLGGALGAANVLAYNHLGPHVAACGTIPATLIGVMILFAITDKCPHNRVAYIRPRLGSQPNQPTQPGGQPRG